MRLGLLLRWSWRDLRARWIQVISIALVIGLGTGSFASFNSLAAWRIASNDASFETTRMYDVRVRLSAGSYVPAGELTAAIGAMTDPARVARVSERLILPTQIEIETPDTSVLVPGRVIGMDLSSADGPPVNRVHVTAGRGLTPDDAGAATVLLEQKFALAHELPPAGQARLAGGVTVDFVGHALAPEYFIVLTDSGGVYAHATFGVVFTSLQTAQSLADAPGMANDLVLRLAEGASRPAVIADIEAVLASAFPNVGVTVSEDIDDPVFRIVTEDVRGDQQSSNVIAFAIFLGAVFAAFNLTTRMVETQRREIGVAMALGVPAARIAVRPLLVGAQIALLGTIVGVGVGLLIGEGMRGVLAEFLPLPVSVAPFQYGIFAGVAVAGFLAPLVAIAWPVWRAVRVRPVDAIRTGHLAARGGGLAPLLTRLPLPGATFGQLPFRNVARAPRRAMLTVLGVAAAIAVTVVLIGILDSFLQMTRDGEAETLKGNPDRLVIDLVAPIPLDSPDAAAILTSTAIRDAEAGLRVGGALSSDRDDFDVLLQFIDFNSGLWVPTVSEGALDTAQPGVVLAREAASDLGVDTGDTVMVAHPVRQGPASFVYRTSELPVLALHPHPLRTNVYLDISHAALLGMEGMTTRIAALPAPDVDVIDVKRQMFNLEGVASVDTVAGEAAVIDELFEQFIGLLRVMQAVPLLLALLIAYNTASISMDERRREHATMMAFGVPTRTVLRMAVVESLILGALGTLAGMAGGFVLMLYMVAVLLPASLPDIGLTITFTPSSLGVVLALGVLAVGLAPLLTALKLRRTDIPTTLRVME